ncbi:unnamed protein product [Paramecium sonneborni]|uniref:Uncharacterized protein n=1 Tax=Paramecium sonneborni TaxID=65129 RepID=A0A8S1M660_9CILI|nr:unnamed protein product [Paramecium sonneborni]
MAQQEIQRKAKAYLDKHQIEEILGDLVTTLSYHQMKNPIIYIIKYLCTVHCTPKELQEAGIQIDSREKVEQPILCLPFPNLSQHQGQIKKLTKEQFYSCKNKITDQGNNFRSICKLIQDNPKSKPGLFAVDPSSYLIYSDLFDPIVKEKGYLGTPIKDMSYTLTSSILEDVKPFLEESIFVLRRNIPKQRFGSTIQNRQALTKELLQVLSKQSIINYSLHNDLSIMAQEDVRKLQINDKLFKKKDPNQAIINQIFKGLRHPDWPSDRMVLQSNDKQNIVWINREDHLKFKFLNTEKSSITEALDTCCKMNQYLDSKDLVSFDDKFGYHTVKPQFSGLGLTFTLKFKLDSQSINKIKSNNNNLSSKIQNKVFNVQTKEKDKYFTIKSERCTGLTMKQYVEQLCQILSILFEGVIKKSENISIEKLFKNETQNQQQQQLQIQPNVKIVEENHSNSPSKPASSPSHVAIDIIQNQSDEQDYSTFHKKRLEGFQKKQKEMNKTKFNKICELKELVELLKDDTFYFQNSNHKFIIVRRNLKIRRRNIEEIIGLKNQQASDQILKECNLIGNCEKGIFQYKYKGYDYYVAIELDDDLTFIFPITKISISQQLHKIQRIVDTFIPKDYQYAWDNQYGYLTNNNIYLGSGISITCDFPQFIQNDIPSILKELILDDSIQNSNNQFLTLVSLNEYNLQIYRNAVNEILLKQKLFNKTIKKAADNQICESDCYLNNLLWAPSKKCFEDFEGLYTQYISNVAYFNGKNVAPFKNYDKIKFDEYKIHIPQNPAITNIKCTFYRNFESLKYKHEMSIQDKVKMKTKYNELIKNNGWKFGKIHHLEIIFDSSPQDFIQNFCHHWNQIIEQGKEFQKNGNMGFQGPILNDSLLEGFQLEIKTNKPINPELIKIYNYKPSNQRNGFLNQEETITTIISNRPCVLEFELNLIQELL